MPVHLCAFFVLGQEGYTFFLSPHRSEEGKAVPENGYRYRSRGAATNGVLIPRRNLFRSVSQGKRKYKNECDYICNSMLMSAARAFNTKVLQAIYKILALFAYSCAHLIDAPQLVKMRSSNVHIDALIVLVWLIENQRYLWFSGITLSLEQVWLTNKYLVLLWLGFKRPTILKCQYLLRDLLILPVITHGYVSSLNLNVE